VKAKNGDIVKVNYVGRLENEVIFDSTEMRGPMEFELGKGDLIPKFEEAVIGMEIGEKRTITIDHTEAYGEHQEDLYFEMEKEKFPKELDLEIGMPLQFSQEDGQIVLFKVKEIKDNSVVIDANHPLAGENLIFDINLIDIKSGSKIII
jgi:FKBP-type peptidyl-prolyl cis-trans isomerase 2